MEKRALKFATRICGVTLVAGVIGCVNCGGGPALFLQARDREIHEATQAIASAHDDAQRAKAYSARGAAYSEKARYSRVQQLIGNDEYERWFDLAIADHDRAVSLNPASAEIYFNRAQAYYDRGSLDLIYLTNPYDAKPRNNPWLHAAALDFEKTIDKDPKNSLALDRLGLAYESNNETDKAVRAYTQEMVLDRRLGRERLTNAYCVAGYEQQLNKDWPAALAAYRKSVEFGLADSESCPTEPFAAMVAIYTTESRQYDQAWEMIEQAQKAGRRIAPDLIERLRKNSGAKSALK